MRSDMAKVIVERPRRGSRWKALRKESFRDDELALSHAGVRRYAKLHGASKGLNENLNPLRRYLERQVGRPWDDVWSEICANLKPSNTVQQHVRDHVPDFVATKTAVRDGQIWVLDRWRGGALKDSYARLYVDPSTGILCRNAQWTSWSAKRKAERDVREKERAARLRVVDEATQLHLFEGTWWEVRLAPIRWSWQFRKEGEALRRVLVEHIEPDVVLNSRFGTMTAEELYGRRGVRAAAKRQLSKKEMRDLGLPRPH